MKLLVLLTVLFICITFSEQVAKFINCPIGLPREREKYVNQCIEVTCLPAHTVETVGCPVDDCWRVIRVIKGDPKKEYPDCCDRTLCMGIPPKN